MFNKNIGSLFWVLLIIDLSTTQCYSYNEDEISQQKCVDYIQEAQGRSCTEYPYQALLGYGENRNSTDWWGFAGVIMSDRHILTDAYVANQGVTRVAVGVRNAKGSDAEWQVHEVSYFIHANYSRPTNDLALLKTKTLIEFSESVQPACLPSNVLNDEEAVLTTWRQKRTWFPGDTIRSIHVQKFTEEECASDERFNYTIHVCYGHRNDLEESCDTWFGDPLVVSNPISPCVSTVIGVQSYEEKCGERPGGYTKVSHYIPWIESVVWPGDGVEPST